VGTYVEEHQGSLRGTGSWVVCAEIARWLTESVDVKVAWGTQACTLRNSSGSSTVCSLTKMP
jgi:hypothetical protein